MKFEISILCNAQKGITTTLCPKCKNSKFRINNDDPLVFKDFDVLNIHMHEPFKIIPINDKMDTEIPTAIIFNMFFHLVIACQCLVKI